MHVYTPNQGEPIGFDPDINPGRMTKYFLSECGHKLHWETWRGDVQDGEGTVYSPGEIFDPAAWDWKLENPA